MVRGEEGVVVGAVTSWQLVEILACVCVCARACACACACWTLEALLEEEEE